MHFTGHYNHPKPELFQISSNSNPFWELTFLRAPKQMHNMLMLCHKEKGAAKQHAGYE